MQMHLRLVLLCVLYLGYFSFVVDVDSIYNLGRAPLITEWEAKHALEELEELSAEWQGLLDKTKDFIQKGKFLRAEKMFKHIIEGSNYHPAVLQAFGKYNEESKEESITALHYYIYSLHQNTEDSITISLYNRILPLVQHYDQQLFAQLQNKQVKFNRIELPQENTLAIIHAVQKRKKIEHVYHTNAIEGNSISMEAVAVICNTGSFPVDEDFHEHEVHEIKGVLQAFEHSSQIAIISYQNHLQHSNKSDRISEGEMDTHQTLLMLSSSAIEKNDEITLQNTSGMHEQLWFILQIHRMILGAAMPSIAGVYRTKGVSVGGYVPPHHSEVPELMRQYSQWLEETEYSTSLHVIERASLAHFQLTWIHPFQDGNGRTARMVMNTIMMQRGYPPILIRLDDKERYYEALRSAQRSGDTRPFIYFIYQIALRSIEEYIEDLQFHCQKYSDESLTAIEHLII